MWKILLKEFLGDLKAQHDALPELERPWLASRIELMETTDMAVVVSQSQNELKMLDDQGLDIRPHRERMNREDLAEKFKDALRKRGPSGVGMFGSGQWTIWEGYAANKLFKAGFRSNNIDPNARHCMASAVMGFMRTFGIDELRAALRTQLAPQDVIRFMLWATAETG